MVDAHAALDVRGEAQRKVLLLMNERGRSLNKYPGGERGGEVRIDWLKEIVRRE